MSWSVTTGKVPAETVEDAIDALEVPHYEGSLPEWDEQLAAAKNAAKVLIQSEALGTGNTITVALTGHANPGHEARSGWSSDFIQISVSRETVQPPEPADHGN